MSSGTERSRALIDAARARGGEALSQRDLELWGHLDIRLKGVAEHILWENRTALLAAFDDLVTVLDDSPAPAARAAEPRPAPEPALDQRPEARFGRLMQWREGHDDKAAREISDQDLARLASSGATTSVEVEQAAARLSSHPVVARHAKAISVVLGGRAAEAPAAEPAPAPAPVQVAAPEPEPVDPFAPFAWERVSQFAPFSWSEGGAEAYGHLSAEYDDGTVRLAWTPAPTAAPVTLYRIVESTSNWPSGAPELGGLVGVTRSTSGSVPMRGSGPVTYLAVWANQGDSILDASHRQPVLVGVGQIVWPPRDLSAQVTANRTVAALLTAPEGSRVEVQRFLKGATVSYDINRELDKELVSSTGFRDLTPPMGEDIVYAAFCVAELADGSSMVSTPATVEARVTPEVQQIQVQVQRSTTTPGAYDISWLRPSHGRVLLFATPERPPVGLENEPRTAEIIEGQGLTPQYRINYPPTDLGGLMTIRDYAVDESWVRAHFVAVHWVSDESVWVGPAVSMVTPKAPDYAQIVERVDAQVITFAWPEGVTVVQAYQGPRGQSVEPEGSEPIAQLTRDDYVRMGGMRITRTLPSNGCAIHLYGVVYLDGRPMYSEPAPLDYPGMTRLKYQVVGYGPDGAPAQGARPASYRIYAEVDDDLHETPLAVVGQLGRIPLHPQDGRMLSQPTVSLRAGISTYVAELPAGQTLAFIRLFVNLPPAETGAVAVLDPAVYTLEVAV